MDVSGPKYFYITALCTGRPLSLHASLTQSIEHRRFGKNQIGSNNYIEPGRAMVVWGRGGVKSSRTK